MGEQNNFVKISKDGITGGGRGCGACPRTISVHFVLQYCWTYSNLLPMGLHVVQSVLFNKSPYVSQSIANCTFYHSSRSYHGFTWLYLTPLHSTMALLGSIHDSTTLYHGSTWFSFTLLHSSMALLDSTTLYHSSNSRLYFTLLHSTTALPVYT